MSNLPLPDADIPPSWPALCAGYRWTAVATGCSSAEVFRLDAADRPALYAKREPIEGHAELADEALRLRWLQARGLPTPRVVEAGPHAGHAWLLMTALPGCSVAEAGLPPQQQVEILAQALLALHRQDAASCPFDMRLSRRIEDASRRVDSGQVDEDDFDDAHLGKSARALHAELLARRPAAEGLVVVHGDATPDNLMVDGGRFAGFIDCARLGVADRYQDLAIAHREIVSDFGDTWGRRFLAAYGLPVGDEHKLAYYRLLDEFF